MEVGTIVKEEPNQYTIKTPGWIAVMTKISIIILEAGNGKLLIWDHRMTTQVILMIKEVSQATTNILQLMEMAEVRVEWPVELAQEPSKGLLRTWWTNQNS